MERKQIVYDDEKSFQKILTNYFPRLQSYLKLKLYNIKVRFIKYSDGLAFFEFPYLENFNTEREKEVNIFIKNKKGDEFFGFFTLIGKDKDNIVQLKPDKFIFYKIERIETRINLLDGKNEYVYISDITSDFLIKEYLTDNHSRIDKIKEEIKGKLQKEFDYVNIYFSNEKGSKRYNHFLNKIIPIYIKNINGNPDENDRNDFLFYKENIYKDDKLLNEKKYISEITVPVLHRMKLPYGYIQVNCRSSINHAFLHEMKKLAVSIDQLINKYNIIPVFYEKITVSDVSRSGMAVIFKDRKYIKYFKEKSLVCFDLFLPADLKVNILASVRNIEFSNANIKIGFEFKEIDALSQVYYEEFFETLKK